MAEQRLQKWADDVRKNGSSAGLQKYIDIRTARTEKVEDQKKILSAVAADEVFALHDRTNALIALAWTVLETNDTARLRTTTRRLYEALPGALALTPSEVVAKDRLFVSMSLLTVLWHLHLLAGDFTKLSKVLIQIRSLIEGATDLTPAFYHTANNAVRGYMMLFGRLLSKGLRSEANRCAVSCIQMLRKGFALSDGNNGKIYFAEFAGSTNAVVAMKELLEADSEAEDFQDAIDTAVAAFALRVAPTTDLTEKLSAYVLGASGSAPVATAAAATGVKKTTTSRSKKAA